MLGWLFASPSERRLLPGGRFRGPTPFVIAVMTFAMMTVAAAGLALSNAAGLVVQGIENRYAVQLPAGSGALPQALAAARSAPGVRQAEPVPEAEMRKTLERWMGPAGLDAGLPVPALVTLDVADEPTGNVDAEMARRLLHLFTSLNRLGTTVVVATHDLGLIAATPGAQMVRLEHGAMVDPTGLLKNPPRQPQGHA